MNGRRWISRSVFALAAAWMLLAASHANAAPLDNRIPSDALVYLGWQGADALAPAYAASNLKGVIDASTAPAYIEQLLDMLKQKAAADGNGADAKINAVQKSLLILWRHPGAIYVGPIDIPAAGKGQDQIPKFRLALLSQAGDDAKEVVDTLQKQLHDNPPPPELHLNVTQDNDVVLITLGEVTADDFKPQGTGLAASDAYKNAMAQVDSDAALTAFVNAKAIVDSVNNIFAQVNDIPADVKQKAPVIIDALGLNGLGEMAFTGKFDNKVWRERAFLATHGPRTGLIALMDTEPISDALLQMIPADVITLNTGRIDLTKTLALVREVAGKVDPHGVEIINRGLAMAGAVSGVDIEKDLINPLGDEWGVYRTLPADGKLNITIVHRPRDPQTLTTTLAALEDLINTKGGGRVSVQKIPSSNDIEVSAIHLPQADVSWLLRNGVLYVSVPSLDGVGDAVQQVEGKKPSILTNPAFTALLAQLPVQKGISINYGDPAKMYPEIVKAVRMILPMLMMRGINVPSDILPDADKVTAFMTPGADISWSDESGFHSFSITAFPGAGVLTGQQGSSEAVAGAAVGTAILLPSLGRARELSERSYDQANARGIGTAANVWAADNNNQMPDHLGRLLIANWIVPKQLINRRGSTKPLDLSNEELDKAKNDYDGFTHDVDAHSDWVYLGKGMPSDTDSTVVLIYEKPASYTTDGLSMGFQDAHSEFVRWSGVREALEGTNIYLKKKGLTPIDVDALMQNAPPQFRTAAPGNAP